MFSGRFTVAALLCAALVRASSAGFAVTARAWCENSMRLDILPDPMPPAAAATIRQRESMLKRRGLTAIPDALSEVDNSCTPGTPTSSLTSPLHSGNLVAKTTADGLGFVFSNKGTGKVSRRPRAPRWASKTTLPSSNPPHTHCTRCSSRRHPPSQSRRTPGRHVVVRAALARWSVARWVFRRT